MLWLGKADPAHQATRPLDGWSPGGLRGPWGAGGERQAVSSLRAPCPSAGACTLSSPG